MKTINDVIFDIPYESGNIGRLHFDNNYGIYVLEKRLDEVYVEYNLTFLRKLNDEAWTTDMDNNMEEISPNNPIVVNTVIEVNSYIQQLEAIPGPVKPEPVIYETTSSSGSGGSEGI